MGRRVDRELCKQINVSSRLIRKKSRRKPPKLHDYTRKILAFFQQHGYRPLRCQVGCGSVEPDDRIATWVDVVCETSASDAPASDAPASGAPASLVLFEIKIHQTESYKWAIRCMGKSRRARVSCPRTHIQRSRTQMFPTVYTTTTSCNWPLPTTTFCKSYPDARVVGALVLRVHDQVIGNLRAFRSPPVKPPEPGQAARL